MAMEYFCCYHSYRRKIAKLSDQEVGRLFRTLLEYSETGEAQELAGREAVAFDFIADDIDRTKENYAAKVEALVENGRKGAQSRWAADDSKNGNCYNSIASDSKNGQNKSKSENKDKSDIEKESRKKKAAPFSPPTLDEVRDYCAQRGGLVDPKRFFDYFQAADWTDTKGQKVRNWKQKCISWERYAAPPAEKPTGREITPAVTSADDIEKMKALMAGMKGQG